VRLLRLPFVKDAFFRKLNELPFQLGASHILAYCHTAGSIIPIPCKRPPDILIVWHKDCYLQERNARQTDHSRGA
jgi:hypothetical protein